MQLDSLQNPCADLGMDVPSMLHYKYYPEKEVSMIWSFISNMNIGYGAIYESFTGTRVRDMYARCH